MSIPILTYIVIGFIILIIIWMILMEHRLKKFFAGTKARNLEEVMLKLGEQISEINESQVQIKKHLSIVDNRLDKSIRNVKTIRFNPFVEAGSNQSFAISFLNDEGDGVIISSLYARDKMSIFAKPISKGKSEFELTEEERGVLDKSLSKQISK